MGHAYVTCGSGTRPSRPTLVTLRRSNVHVQASSFIGPSVYYWYVSVSGLRP